MRTVPTRRWETWARPPGVPPQPVATRAPTPVPTPPLPAAVAVAVPAAGDR
ncbi:hypothetical protein [Streptomyces mayonensis]|uniref:hypothetical protein n=1 Tax=Streptomyces mayonensis TaxID=2750816 RepID=UPI001C1E8BCB|nr:hypothetical protein [Streptomyces sp. A108]MBU6536772.1 hypothetical protein [Streptomyces sp. A108]